MFVILSVWFNSAQSFDLIIHYNEKIVFNLFYLKTAAFVESDPTKTRFLVNPFLV
jgi:hypothetical protein